MAQDNAVANGNMFEVRDKKHDKYPDWRGDVTLTAEMVEKIAKGQGGELKLSIAGWYRESPRAGQYLSMKLEFPMAPREPGNAPQQKPQGYKKPQEQEDLDDEIPF